MKPHEPREVVILMEEAPDHSQRCRFTVLPQHGLDVIVERERAPLDGAVLGERVWYWQHEERALTGQRIFREIAPPPPPEWKENPIFDEMVVKEPLPFTWPPSYDPRKLTQDS
jgi:hypothetical protein